ncbi:11607_t:CDS:2 [Funneliformis caledonium]|uniref:11607_t:CDS:1 n=1 Tax=Funneliformis caledonium TaxID=1117310 RepID=A0A9N8Z4K7_9GLOM|nr:11607_t:CDS:2 [Funneliformis caledonium]
MTSNSNLRFIKTWSLTTTTDDMNSSQHFDFVNFDNYFSYLDLVFDDMDQSIDSFFENRQDEWFERDEGGRFFILRQQRYQSIKRLYPKQYNSKSSPSFSSTASTYSRCVERTGISSVINHYFIDFNDIIIYTNSNDLLNLSIGLVQRQQRSFLSFNVNAFKKGFDDIEWNLESYKMKKQPNAGGGSFLSEIFSCEIITRILNVELFKTEMEIDYFFENQPMTDYLVNFRHLFKQTSALTLGVSVTRAYAHKRSYTKLDAYRLLAKKLAGINCSTRNITNAKLWKQVLHIWCPSGKVARIVRKVYNKLDNKLKSNTVVIVTIVNCKWVFTNKR